MVRKKCKCGCGETVPPERTFVNKDHMLRYRQNKRPEPKQPPEQRMGSEEVSLNSILAGLKTQNDNKDSEQLPESKQLNENKTGVFRPEGSARSRPAAPGTPDRKSNEHPTSVSLLNKFRPRLRSVSRQLAGRNKLKEQNYSKTIPIKKVYTFILVCILLISLIALFSQSLPYLIKKDPAHSVSLNQIQNPTLKVIPVESSSKNESKNETQNSLSASNTYVRYVPEPPIPLKGG